MRTIIEVPDEVIRSLDQVSRGEKRSRAALIRDAIEDYLCKKATPQSEAAFGLWKEAATDGVKFQNDLRDDWDQE